MHTKIKTILSQNSKNSSMEKQQLQEVFLQYWELNQLSTYFFLNFLIAKVSTGVFIEDLTEANIYKCLSSIIQRRKEDDKSTTAQ
jgi:hypothetical protein